MVYLCLIGEAEINYASNFFDFILKPDFPINVKLSTKH